MVEQHRRTCQASLVSSCVIRAGLRTLYADLETTIAERMGNDWYVIGRRLGVAKYSSGLPDSAGYEGVSSTAEVEASPRRRRDTRTSAFNTA